MNYDRLKYLLAVIAIFFFFVPSHAQVRFQKTFGGVNSDVGAFIHGTSDGGYLIGAGTGSFGLGGIYLIKLDSMGDTLWTKVYGGMGNEAITHVIQSIEGGYMVLGETTSFGLGGTDIYLIHIDVSGDTLWTKTYGGALDDYGRAIHQTTDNGYFIVGTTNSFGGGLSDAYLLKLDIGGDLVWSKTFGKTDSLSSEGAVSGLQTLDDGFLLAGTTSEFGGGGSAVIYLIKTNNNGDTLWTKTYGGANNDNGNGIVETADSELTILGTTASFGGGVYLVHTDSDGDTLWTRVYSDSAGLISKAMTNCSDGGYIITGSVAGTGANMWDVFLIRIDSGGDTTWTMQYDNDVWDEGYSVKQTSDGGFVVTGFTGGFTQSSRDVYVIKTDADGNTGCGNETRMDLSVGSTNTVVNSTNTIVGSGGVVGNTNTIVNNTNTVESVLCFDTITSIDIFSDGSPEILLLSIFPNPFSDFATIEAVVPDKFDVGQLRIVDLLGVTHKVISLSGGYNDVTLLKGDLPASGIYFCILEANERVIEKTKFISLR